MKTVMSARWAPARQSSLTQHLFAPVWEADIASQLLAWPWRAILLRLALLIFVVMPILLATGTVGLIIGSIIGGGTGMLAGSILGTFAGLAALFSEARG